MTGVVVLVAVLAGAAAFGLARRQRDGRLRGPRSAPLLDLGVPLGRRATLLQFSSPSCAPCRAARRLLADVAAHREGVTHVEIGVADRADLVRLLDIRRTPTVLVLGPQGQITRRASGVPRRDDLIGAITSANAGDTGRGRA